MRSLPAAGVALAFWICTGPTANAQSPIPNLIRALESDKKPVRLQAAIGLGNCGKGAHTAAPALKALVEREFEPQIILAGMKALTQIGAHAELLALLQYSGPHVRPQAVWGLGVIGPDAKKATPELVRVLKDRDPVLRGLAAKALGEIGLQAPEEARALLGALADPNSEVRWHAQGALICTGTLSLPVLEGMLNDRESAAVRPAVLQILASQGPAAKDAVPTLKDLLKDPDADIRTQTIGTLAAMGSAAKDALPALFESLHDKDMKVQVAAFNAAMTIGMEDRRALSEGFRRANARGRWASAPKESVSALTAKLKEKDANVRMAAALALGQHGKDAEAAIPALKDMLNDANPNLRTSAQQALAQLDQKNREDYLRRRSVEQAQLLRESQASYAKVFNGIPELLQRRGALLQKAAIPDSKGPSNVPLCVLLQNKPQQAYIQQLVMMHIASTLNPGITESEDWVRDRILELGTEAVPLLAQGFRVGIDYQLGFV